MILAMGRRVLCLKCAPFQTIERNAGANVLISHSDKRGRMGRERTDLLRGTLDLLILKALADASHRLLPVPFE